MIGSANNSGEYEADLEHDIGPGDTMSVINSETVCVNLTVGLDTFRTKHKVYTIGGSLTGDNNYHTLIDLGCEAAKGLLPFEKDLIVSRIWNAVQSLRLNRIDGEGPLEYWGLGVQGNENFHDELSELLETKDGSCSAWANFFKQLLSLQGVDCSICTILINPLNTPQHNNTEFKGFLQKAVPVQGEETGEGDCRMHAMGNSGRAFKMHKIVKYIDLSGQALFFDPGNGGGPYTSWQQYVTYALDFWFKDGISYDNFAVSAFNDPAQYFLFFDLGI